MGKCKLYLVLLLIFLLTACHQAPETLRLGTNIWPGYEPLYLARSRNFLDSDKIDLVEFSVSSQVMQAYRNKLIDAAALTLDEVIQLLETGETPRIILVMDFSNGGDAIVAQPDITTFNALKGKRIGAENNALGAYILQRAVDINQIDKHSVTIIPLDTSEQLKAFQDKRIDAVVTFEPVKGQLIKQGGHVLFDSTQIPGEIVDVLVIRDSFIKQHSSTVQHLISAWYRSLDFIKSHPEEAAIILGKRLKLDVKSTQETYKGLTLADRNINWQQLFTSKPALLNTANTLTSIMLKSGLINHAVDPRRCLLTSNEKKLLHILKP